MSAGWLEIADGVYARRYAELDLTTGLVVGAERCLVVDTRGDLEQGAELATAVRAITSLPWTVVYTHAHFDHAWGTEPFLPCEVWAHEDCRAELDDSAETARAQWIDHYRDEGKPATAEAIARTRIIRPDRTFAGRVQLELGGRAVVLLHAGLAHTGHDVVVHVPDAGVLFAGDVVEHAEAGFSADSFGPETHLAAWPDTLDVLLDLEPSVVVPGHGDPVHADFVRRHRDGLRRLVALKAALDRAETTKESAIAASPYPADVTEAAFADHSQ
jgi:glyoxylase-like metal-dependent hydrolase (beta-lactamase superfamily II)